MKKYPGFEESVRKGKIMADKEIDGSSERVFRRAVIGYTYQQMVTHETKMPAKITKFLVTMDETFLNKDSDGLQVRATESASEKVAATVATFLPEDREDMRIVRVTTKIFPLHTFNNYHLHAYN